MSCGGGRGQDFPFCFPIHIINLRFPGKLSAIPHQLPTIQRSRAETSFNRSQTGAPWRFHCMTTSILQIHRSAESGVHHCLEDSRTPVHWSRTREKHRLCSRSFQSIWPKPSPHAIRAPAIRENYSSHKLSLLIPRLDPIPCEPAGSSKAAGMGYAKHMRTICLAHAQRVCI